MIIPCYSLPSSIVTAIEGERQRQLLKWGIQNHSQERWLTILAEEMGEIAKAILEDKPEEYIMEIIHLIAVGVAALEDTCRP